MSVFFSRSTLEHVMCRAVLSVLLVIWVAVGVAASICLAHVLSRRQF